MKSRGEQQHAGASESSLPKMKDKQCPYFLNEMNDAGFGDSIDLTGESILGQPDPPIVLHLQYMSASKANAMYPWQKLQEEKVARCCADQRD
ncbi:hypothetical protein SLA2020_105790 [Shorea laevis]